MDTPILIILVVFILAVIVLAFRYRQQIVDEVEDFFDGDDDESTQASAPPPKPNKDAAPPIRPVTPQPVAPIQREEQSALPEPVEEAPAPEPAASWDIGSDEAADYGSTRGGESSAAPEAPTSAIVPDQVKFSAYYPRETAPQLWQPLAAYVFRSAAATDVIKDVGTVLGQRVTDFRRSDDTARQTLQDGAMITAALTLPGFQVNPPQVTLGFYEPFHRFDFKIRATSAPVDLAVNGMMTFTVDGIIVADLPISIFIGRLVGETLTGAVTKPAYQSIFCSYSRDDSQIVERVERAYKALGLTYLRDVESLRSGQNWNEELMKLIEKADIFQLFWSQTAAESKYVRQEWEYALRLSRQVRPVYWQKPIPRVPDELRSIHFAYMPDLAE